jgi:peptide/nickel transport system permease protein
VPELPPSAPTEELPGSDLLPAPGEELLREELAAGGDLSGAGAQVAAVSQVGRRTGKLGIGAWVAIGWVVFIVLIAVLAKTGIVTWGDPQNSIAACARKGPHIPWIGDVTPKEGHAVGHFLGCDGIGRDMEARLALGAWTSLLVSTGAVALGLLLGGSLGLIAGYFGGKIDTFLTGMFNVLLSIPAVIFALALVAFLQASSNTGGSSSALSPELTLIIAIGVVSIPLLGRITRASALSWSQRDFVLAARAQGAKNVRIMVRELLPNVLPAMFSIALLGVAIAIVAEGALAILGVGVKPPTPSWGNIIAGDRENLFSSPHITFEASALIFFTVLALNYLGDVVRAYFDVREAAI